MSAPSTTRSSIARPALALFAWHRPLLWLSVAMAALIGIAIVGLALDPRLVSGAPLWAKPLKFAISILIYSLTLSWLISMLKRWRRFAWWAGTTAGVFLGVEMVIIVGAAAAGTTSHFNVTTPLTSTLWAIMGGSIAIVWLATLAVGFALFRADLGDRARTLAIRAGVGIALLGMALGFLMTLPTPDQLNDFQGVAGAHAVGAPDDGAGLPLLGWSTIGGDLRIPHFVGMHALQVFPLAAIALELVARHVRMLRPAATRIGILWVGVGLYLGVIALLTAQALSGQSIVRPDAAVATIAIGLFTIAAFAIASVVAANRDSAGHRIHDRSSLDTTPALHAPEGRP